MAVNRIRLVAYLRAMWAHSSLVFSFVTKILRTIQQTSRTLISITGLTKHVCIPTWVKRQLYSQFAANALWYAAKVKRYLTGEGSLDQRWHRDEWKVTGTSTVGVCNNCVQFYKLQHDCNPITKPKSSSSAAAAASSSSSSWSSIF